MKKILKTLLVGFGNVAEKISNDKKMKKFIKYQTHAQVLQDHPFFICDAVVEIDASRREVAKKKWNIPIVVKTLNDLPQDYLPDVVVLTTPPEERIKILKNINCKGILVEKPLGTSLNNSKVFYELCKNKKIKTQVNFFRRFDDKMFDLKKNLSKKLGSIQCGFCVYGNGLRNNAIHMIDLIRFLFGEIISVMAFPGKENRENINFILELKNNVLINFAPIDFTFYREVYLDIWGTKSRIEIFQEGLFIKQSKIRSHRALEKTKEISIDNSNIKNSNCGLSYYNVYTDYITQ